jgi:hypothetical protein
VTSADVFQARKRRVEFRGGGARVVRAVPHEKPVLVAMPFAVDGDRIIELRGTDLSEKTRSQHFGQEFLAGRGDGRLLSEGWFVSGAPADIDLGPLARHDRSPQIRPSEFYFSVPGGSKVPANYDYKIPN